MPEKPALPRLGPKGSPAHFKFKIFKGLILNLKVACAQ